jgi:hypothetical protein
MIARVNSLVFTTLLELATGGLALPSSGLPGDFGRFVHGRRVSLEITLRRHDARRTAASNTFCVAVGDSGHVVVCT